MSDIIKTYAQVVADTVAQIAGETEAIDKAAQLVADAIKRDELVHVIGPGGHSNMAVEEVLWRAGGLAPVDAILDAGTNVIHGAKRSNIIERCPGYGIRVLDAYGINKPGEVMIIVNAYGINSMTIRRRARMPPTRIENYWHHLGQLRTDSSEGCALKAPERTQPFRERGRLREQPPARGRRVHRRRGSVPAHGANVDLLQLLRDRLHHDESGGKAGCGWHRPTHMDEREHAWRRCCQQGSGREILHESQASALRREQECTKNFS